MKMQSLEVELGTVCCLVGGEGGRREGGREGGREEIKTVELGGGERRKGEKE